MPLDKNVILSKIESTNSMNPIDVKRIMKEFSKEIDESLNASKVILQKGETFISNKKI